jgi:periplasmic protein TonB
MKMKIIRTVPIFKKKVVFWPVIISLIGHVALISASGMIDLRDNVRDTEIFTVDIRGMEPDKSLPAEEKKEVKNLPAPRTTEKAKAVSTDGVREETVNLGSSDAKYIPYLVKIKRRILQIWEYPQKAYDKNEEGVVVIKISLDARGNLAATNLVSSSGSALLDAGALGIVKAAAPFEPLPDSYGLARLHILASFRYKLIE